MEWLVITCRVLIFTTMIIPILKTTLSESTDKSRCHARDTQNETSNLLFM
jgi:hypothetical protein